MRDGGLRSLLGQAKRSFWLFFGGIWLIVGLIMLSVGIGMAVEERQWSGAVRTTGMVLTKDLVRADSDSSTQYRIRFRYATEDGATIEGDDQIDVSTWEALTERGPVDVYYLPGSSDPPRLEPGGEPFGPLIFLTVGVVLSGVGGLLFGRAAVRLLRARRLLRTGIDAEGTVTGVEQTDVSFNRRPQFRVRYRYTDAGGATHTGDSGYLDWDDASTFDEDDPVAIRYDRDRPADSLWLGHPEPAAGPPVDAAPARIVDAPPPT